MANTVDHPVGEREPVGVDPRRTWLERVALLLVVAAVGQILRYALQGWAFAEQVGPAMSPDGFEWQAFQMQFASAGDVGSGILLVGALALVVLAPGPPARLAAVVANAVSVLGVVMAAAAALGIHAAFRTGSDSYVTFGDDESVERLYQGAQVAGLLPAAALALGTAYAAWCLLRGGFGLPTPDLGPVAPADRPDDGRSPEPPSAVPPRDPGSPVDDDAAWSPRPPDGPPTRP